MAQPRLSEALAQEAVAALAQHGNKADAARALGIPRATFTNRIEAANRPVPLPEPEIDPAVKKPVFRVRAYPPTLGDVPSRRVCFIGDSHWQPGLEFQHMTWIGRHVAENRPDNVVHIGDALELGSCEMHSPAGSASHAAKPAFIHDIEAGEEALQAYHREIPVGDIPHDITYGNHEYRAWRLEEAAPNLAGTLTLQLEQLFARYRWKTHPYRQWLFLEGVGITHVPHNIMQKPIGGRYPENTIGNQATHSIIFGHTHRYNHVTIPKIGINNSITVTNVGSAIAGRPR
jgi:predicted phosphodiesterase